MSRQEEKERPVHLGVFLKKLRNYGASEEGGRDGGKEKRWGAFLSRVGWRHPKVTVPERVE